MRSKLVACLAMLAVAQAGAAPAATTAHVHVLDTLPTPSFAPAEVVIRPGDAVNWDNHATRIHTVTHAACPRIDLRNDPAGCFFDTFRDRGADLDPGATFTVAFPSPGIFEYVCAIHRFGGRITVLSEDGTLPDLVIDAVSVHPAPLGTSRRIEAIVGNDGAASAPASRAHFEIRPLGSEAWSRFGDVEVGSLAPGQRRTLNQDLTTFNKLGDFELRVVADGAGSLAEGDETNNAASAAFSVLLPPGTLPGIALPDPPPPQPVSTRLPSPLPTP